MAHFAEIDENNIVIRVLVVPDHEEHRGQDFLANDLGLGGTWIQTSYNTVLNQHQKNGVPLRGNYAGIGMIYDPTRDIFYDESPYPSWVWNDAICGYEAPISMPTDGAGYIWDETIINWKISE